MASKDPDFSVIVVAFNSGRVLPRCLDALSRQSFENFEVLLVDNGPEAGTIETPRSLNSRTRVLTPGKNLGFAAGNNLAARAARADWLVLLNPDAFAKVDWLARIDEAIRRYPDVSMFGSTQLRADDPALLDGAGDHYHPLGLAWRGGEGGPAETVDTDAEVFGPCAAAAVYRREVFEKAGGFSEGFFCYYEDVDLAFRLRIAGELCVQLAKARVDHVGSATVGAGSDFIRYHVTRNRIWTFLRGMPGPLLFALLPGLVATLAARLMIAAVTGGFAARTRAIIDALAGLPWVLRERRDIQTRRRISVMRVARILTWSVGKLVLRARDARPLPAEPGIEGRHEAS
jgi:N-acetylglucosaminyl-diphospho-decaprenol L-rhamnosyltransferase